MGLYQELLLPPTNWQQGCLILTIMPVISTWQFLPVVCHDGEQAITMRCPHLLKFYNKVWQIKYNKVKKQKRKPPNCNFENSLLETLRIIYKYQLKDWIIQRDSPKSMPALSISSESRSEEPCWVSERSVTWFTFMGRPASSKPLSCSSAFLASSELWNWKKNGCHNRFLYTKCHLP